MILWLVIPKKDEIVEIVDEKDDKKTKKTKTLAKEIRKEVKGEKVKSGNFLGVILIIFGLLILIERMFQFMIRWDYVWPVVLIISGFYLVFKD